MHEEAGTVSKEAGAVDKEEVEVDAGVDNEGGVWMKE